MPLLDHFHPPLSLERHWESFHSAWANETARLLNLELLPDGYFAEPNVRLSGGIEIDLAALERPTGSRGGTATATWAPSAPTLRLPLDLERAETFEVRVLRGEGGPEVVAAVELVSPANKDRPEHRRAFAVKCAAYLSEGVSLVAVDVVTSRRTPLHGAILESLGTIEADGPEFEVAPLSAIAYRLARGSTCLEAWAEALRLGQALPAVPLWLGADLAVPLDLERSYASACEALRIPQPSPA